MSKKLALAAVLGGLVGTAAADVPPPGPQPIPTANDDAAVPVDAPAPVVVEPTVDPEPVTTDVVVQPVAPAPAHDTVIVADTQGVAAYAWSEPRLQSGIGVGLTIGGGLSGFTDRTMRDSVSTQVSGLWDARLTLGTHIPLGLDLNYVGSAVNVNTLGGTKNGTLIGTTAEAALRWNILPHQMATPYLFGGIGWQRFDLTNRQLATADSGMQASDNFMEVPMGVGFAVRQMNGFTFDARGTYRQAVSDSDLVRHADGNGFASPSSWEASANLGYEF